MIELRGIARTFRVGDQQVHALRDVDLDIGRGEYLSLMGPSGSGKSTLLNVIGLLDRASGGRYRFCGEDVTDLDDAALAQIRRQRIGFVFQAFHLVPRLTTAQNVAVPLLLGEVPAAERRERVAEQLAAFGLSDRAHHLPEQLSGGQRQRAAIARATIARPEVLLADEPTGNLDRRTGEEVVAVLEKLQQGGLTLIVVTHDPDLGRRATRRLRMQDGRLVADEAGAAAQEGA
ncbi:MAG: ABC transporter ATP-binding protein [Planctomycetes bacterium]|nr:ABC transporter ATP-binding protein [Planctomycetota bacterium]MCB9884271.1 ABC transporter ATP-binding protein [Planctomycetota bacterium]